MNESDKTKTNPNSKASIQYASSFLENFHFFHKWEVVIKYLYTTILKNMPKHNRVNLGRSINQKMWEIEEKIIIFGFNPKARKELIDELDLDFKVLIRMLSVGSELKIIKYRSFVHIVTKIDELGKILGGIKKKL